MELPQTAHYVQVVCIYKIKSVFHHAQQVTSQLLILCAHIVEKTVVQG